MDVWQRGASFSETAGVNYTADRWAVNVSAVTTTTISRVASGLTGFNYALRYQRNNGTTNTPLMVLGQSIETANSLMFAGKQVTLSFYARVGANYSASTLNYVLATGTGTDESVMNGYTGGSFVINNGVALSTSWQRVTATATLSSSATEIGLQFNYYTTGTAGANDYFDITGVQLDLGPVALPYRRNGSTYEAELAACQRYFYAVNDSRAALGFYYASGSVAYAEIKLSVTMRTTPSVTSNPTLSYYTFFAVGAAMGLSTAPALDNGGPNNVLVGFTASTGVAGQTGVLGVTDSRGYIWFSAEL
jgi:hypothetical protein